MFALEETSNGQTLVGAYAERFARSVSRSELLKRALVFGVTVTFLDHVATARGDDGDPPVDANGDTLTFPAITSSPNCCCCSPACYTILDANGNPACGCQLACCYKPPGSGNPCAKRFAGHGYPHYCWTCPQGGVNYICCDFYCNNQACICSSRCDTNQCGTVC
jgi:hypothetical protein